MYNNPNQAFLPQGVDDDQALEHETNQQHLDDFFEDIYYELRNYGKLEELNVCDNSGRKYHPLQKKMLICSDI